jgi:hypothetical protein
VPHAENPCDSEIYLIGIFSECSCLWRGIGPRIPGGSAKAKAKFSDKMLVKHANRLLDTAEKDHGHTLSEKVSGWVRIRLVSAKDEHLTNSLYLFCLIWALAATARTDVLTGDFPWDLVCAGENLSAKQKLDNASLVITLARKLGATVYITAKDIVDHKTDMIITLLAAILGRIEAK